MPHSALHDAIADWLADVEATVEEHSEGRVARIIELLREPTLRNAEIWLRCFEAAQESGGPLTADDWDVDLDDLILWPKDERGFTWQAVIQTALSAAKAQYDAENVLMPMWEALQRGGLAVMAAAAGVPRPLSAEAKKGPGRARFDSAKQRRRGNVAL